MNKRFLVLVLMSLFVVSLVGAEIEDNGRISHKYVEATGIHTIEFIKEGAVFDPYYGEGDSAYGKMDFEYPLYQKFKPKSGLLESFMIYMDGGTILKMDVTAANETQVYINGMFLDLKKDFRLFFDGTELMIYSPDGSFAFDELPKIFNSKLPGVPKTITYNAALGDVKLPNGYELNDGVVKYSFEDKSYFVPEGETASLNHYKIDARETAVVVGENFKVNGDVVNLEGDGFDVSFNSPQPQISLASTSNGKYFKLGDKGSDVSKIQKLVGIKQTGEYDAVTIEAVKVWQEENGLEKDGFFGSDSVGKTVGSYSVDFSESKNGKYFKMGDKGDSVQEIQGFLISKGYLPTHNSYGRTNADGDFGSRTKAALARWQKDSELVNDGVFGEKSAVKMGVSGGNVGVALLGGSAKIENKQDGLEMNLDGKTGVILGNKKYYFDGENLNQKLLTSLKSSDVQVPTKLIFDTGFFKEEVIELVPNDRKIGRVKMRDFAVANGIQPAAAQCAGFVTYCGPLVLDGGKSSDEALWFKNLLNSEGIGGSAWEMQNRMLNKDGVSVYDKSSFLDEADLKKINNLKSDIKKEYTELMKKAPTESKARDKYSSKMYKKLSSKYRKDFLDVYHDNDVSMTAPAAKGDVVSLYYRDSGYLSMALMEGENNQANTHVGVISDSIETTLKLKEGQSAKEQIKKALKISDEGLSVNTYAYFDEDGFLKSVDYVEGSFISEDGRMIPEDSELLITRPQLAHMYHEYAGEKDPFHVESLDSVLARDEFTLFGVTRPKSSDYVDSFIYTPDSYDKMKSDLNCITASCNTLNLEQVLRLNGVEESENFANTIRSSTLERKKEFGIPDERMDEFVSMTNAIIKRESNFGDSKWYKVESFLGYGETKGYMQVSDDNVERFSELFDDSSQTVADTSIVNGQRYLAEIFNEYASEDGVLDEETIKVMAAAYNTGIRKPKMAALQKKLQDLGYIEEDVKLTGTYGPATKAALSQAISDFGVQESLNDFTVDGFDNMEIINRINNEYRKSFLEEPPSAIVPEIKHTGIRGTTTTQGYAEGVYANYQKLCLSCPRT